MSAEPAKLVQHVYLEVRMTPEEFTKLKRAADWEGVTVNEYLVLHALGKTRKGC